MQIATLELRRVRDVLPDVFDSLSIVIRTTTTSVVTSLIAVLGFKGLLLLRTLIFQAALNASRFTTFTRRTRTFGFTGYASARLSTIKLALADDPGHEAGRTLCTASLSSFPLSHILRTTS